ncbi:GntR family transcriptional regulator [Kitasatospora aureofaciens]|uniref:GntR family transcriptional regulator n=1 Tax=Kitasatospora aureofaciens TaxID=1894 RepID=A0A1E7N920_KITAU|nr:GntR family transcriptional regulator [Kitasatospora aureofaciens]OEV37196.1 GntR family transcriptional regulator [Kitasatospora aureofaciens]GGU93609.1 GntR family transcriptional regulator [Kitasatospora aureofaciens]
MIGFVLDGRSRVATYMQLVLQVKQALRVGLAQPGDQLPKVREVARALAINPNTVLKAYRELEHEGLAEGRPGVGTFLVGTLAGPSLQHQAELRAELVAWLDRARVAGLSRDDLSALIDTTVRAAFDAPTAVAARTTGGET